MRTTERLQSAYVALNFPFVRQPGAIRTEHMHDMRTMRQTGWLWPSGNPPVPRSQPSAEAVKAVRTSLAALLPDDPALGLGRLSG
jgi:hypothetical protein